MTTAIAPAAPASTKAPANSAANKDEWKKEIHTPDSTFNANVPMDLIERNENNRVPEQADVEKRALEISAIGLLQPIVLRLQPSGKYKIIAGETRWLAFKHLKRLTIPAHIRKGEPDDAGDTERRLIENLGRTDLPVINKARGFKQLLEHGRTQKEVGELFGLSQPVIGNAVRMLALPEQVLEMINSGKLSEAHGVSLARFAKWPAVVTRMAMLVGPHGASAKTLNEWELPFSGQLVRDGLVAEIRTKAHWHYSEDTHPVYKLTDEIRKSPDFIECKGDDESLYIYPLDKAQDLWTPEKKRQDEARVTKAAAVAKQQAADVKSGKLTKEQIERKKTIEKNKKTRAENAAGLALALDKLKRTPQPTTLLIAIIADTVISGGYGAKRIKEAAEALGIALPKGAVSDQGGHGLNAVSAMQKMDVMDLTRIVAAILLIKQVDDANKNAWGMPEDLELVMNSKVPGGDKPAAPAAVLIDVAPTPKAKKPKAAKAKSAKGGRK